MASKSSPTMARTDDRRVVWERREVYGDLDEVVALAVLSEPVGTLIVITDGEEPDEPGDKYVIVVPPWGAA